MSVSPVGGEDGPGAWRARRALGSDMAEIERKPARPKDLGELRTVMAADRTLMAWIRTALSMLSFGFTIYKVLESMADAGPIQNTKSPQPVGLVLAGLGGGSLLLGTIGYWRRLRDLEPTSRKQVREG